MLLAAVVCALLAAVSAHHGQRESLLLNRVAEDAPSCGLPSAAFCVPGQQFGPCPAWLALSGRMNCPCPFDGPTKRFTLVVTRDLVPNILVNNGTNFQVRSVLRVNGTVPGPAIVVDEDDWVEVDVINNITVNKYDLDEGIVVHWHGLLQHGTQWSDGVPAMTQCTIPPSQLFRYRFRASVAGTYWYHSHYLEQYVDGLFGPLIVNPVRTKQPYKYDSDWTLMIQDFHSNAAHDIVVDYYLTPKSQGNEPIPDAVAVNGNLSKTLFYVAKRSEKTRLRFIAANAFSMYNCSIDGVKMTVIEVDGTIVQSAPVAWFVLNVAQRVSIIVDWSDVPKNVTSVWIRVTAMKDMYPFDITGYIPPYELGVAGYPPHLKVVGAKPLDVNWLGVVQFQPTGRVFPNYKGVLAGPRAPPPSDTNMLSLRPLEPATPPAPTHQMYMEIDFGNDIDGVNRGGWNKISYMPSGVPILFDYVLPQRPPFFNYSIPSIDPYHPSPLIPVYHDGEGQYAVPFNAVVDVLINNTDTGEHSIHFHAHQFFCIKTSVYNGPEANPQRRDTISVEAGGWALIRFIADNPGVWAFHCHAEWHMSAGLMATIVAGPDVLAASRQRIPNDMIPFCEGAYALQQDMSLHYPNMNMKMRPGQPMRMVSKIVERNQERDKRLQEIKRGKMGHSMHMQKERMD